MQLKEEDDDLPAFDIGMTSKDSTDVVSNLRLFSVSILDPAINNTTSSNNFFMI